MQPNRRFYLISRDKKFSEQYLVHFLINSFLFAEVNPTRFIVTFRLWIMH